MKLVVGLGNPGSEYANNRHNVGFMAVDNIVRRHSFGMWRKKFKGNISEGVIDGEKILVLKPETYMNLSGESVLSAASFYKIRPSDIIVFHDEMDLAPSKIKVKKGGGSAGHNGLKSITSHLGNEYVRVRIGVGHPGEKSKVINHVLKDFSKSDNLWLDSLLNAISDAFPFLICNKESDFMTKVALILNPNKKNNKEKSNTKENNLKIEDREFKANTSMAEALMNAFNLKK